MKRRDFFGVAGGAAVGCLFPAKSVKARESVKPMLEGLTNEGMAIKIARCHGLDGMVVHLSGRDLPEQICYTFHRAVWIVPTHGTKIHIIYPNDPIDDPDTSKAGVLDVKSLKRILFANKKWSEDGSILKTVGPIYRREYVRIDGDGGWFTLNGYRISHLSRPGRTCILSDGKSW